MRSRAYVVAAWTGALGGGSYGLEAAGLAFAGEMSAVIPAIGWALLGATMCAAAMARRRALQQSRPAPEGESKPDKV